MLLRLKIKNFLSFYEEVSFDMFPNLKRTTFQNHIYNEYDVPILKQAAIYGANGSGKSNFVDALRVIQDIVTTKDTLKKSPISLNKFRLKSVENYEPTVFSIEFFHKKNYFIYNIEIDTEKILKEELFLSGIGKRDNELIFRRDGNRLVSKYANTNGEIKSAANKFLKENPLTSLFILTENFPFFKNNRLIIIAKEWFANQLKILSLRRIIPELIEMLSANEDMLDYTNKIFQTIGVGVKNIVVLEKKVNDILSEKNEENKELKKNIIENLEQIGNYSQFNDEKILMSFEKNEEDELIVKSLMFKHIGLSNFEKYMEINSQSDGTTKILNLIPAFYELEKRPMTIIVDEIENSIHPLLMIKLIKSFSDAKTRGQLIYTTHQTELLNQQELMRPDEVWFTEKHNGQTKLYSLNDFKEHNTINIKNGYLDGRYGAIPFFGNLNE